MILDRFVAGLAVGAVALMAGPARADVLEIGSEGARWIAGAPASAVAEEAAILAGAGAADAIGNANPEYLPEGPFVPEHAVAHTHMSGAGVPGAYRAKVAELAARFDLSPALIEALVWQESRWRSGAVSPVGARGLAQLMPGTARELGVDANDPFANLEGGARYLREQMDRFGGDVEKALAAYNAGPGRVIASGGVPRIRETQLYVSAIMGRLSNHSREQ
ncbi:MAG: lytic transglycosylase domain-containing protein [Qipengyuania sp.]|jgi:soluble lytic murein transglycosylase-like protein|nr:lytic transglycosylase domain-containing protein [Qipengyuania sp.]